MTGRPSDYSQQIASTICLRLAEGASLREICTVDDMPAQSTVYLWLQKHSEFSEQYARAREAQAEHWAEEILEIADDGSNDSYKDDNGNVRTDQEVVARSRLRVDSRKWLMSKLAPKKYGDKVELGHTGKDGGPLVVTWLPPQS
jgi:hypothetical protein